MEIYRFSVNGREVSTQRKTSLLRFLRDELKLRSVKDGCSEGACGTCTVMVDGRAVKSCVLKTERMEGKSVVTVEGLPDEEKEAFVYAFGKAGAVQCGFCTPGMVMCASALLKQNPNPDAGAVKKAIKGNLCRCTGYQKIIEAILLAGAILRGEEQIEPALEQSGDLAVGSRRAFRLDVRDKVLGLARYPDDILEEDLAGRGYRGTKPLAYASCVRSAYPRARVLRIDSSRAEALPGVLGVLRAKDVPVNKVGHIRADWDVMIAEGEITRCIGDALVLVVAESQKILEEARALVRIDYEPLEPVTGIEEARREDAPKVHAGGNLCESRHVSRGDAPAALKESAYIASAHFSTPFIEHAFLEPDCAVAFPWGDGVKILSADQGAYDTRRETAMMFGWEPERVVVETLWVGGGFGGKEDVSVQHLAALAAVTFDRPVKMRLSRQESLRFHPKRHAMEADFTLGCDENGIFTAMDCEIFMDTGAYASLCGPVLERACTHSVGPYSYQNTRIRGYGYYTNNPPAGAFRGFGVTQSEYALEQLINVLADKTGISPWEIRYRNAIEPGKVLPNGQIADPSTALKETLLAVRELYEANAGHAGIACAMKNSGVGVGLPDKGRARIRIEDGKAVYYSCAADIGQGCTTVFAQMICEKTGLPRERVLPGISNTENAPDSGTTSGSRQTLVTGEAICGAALLLKKKMEEAGIGPGGDNLRELEGEEFFYEYFEPTDPLGSDKPFPKSHIAYGFATHLAILDEEGQVKTVVAAHDSGRVVNPVAIEGQIEGGVLMGMGYALTEDFPLKDCVPTAKLGTLGLLRADKIPEYKVICVEKNELLKVACGAKGIGEISAIPTAPAIAGAYYKRDHILRTSLPMEDTFYREKKKGGEKTKSSFKAD